MHQVVCADCGRDCEIPFEPRPGKPVYCNDCFRKRKDNKRHDHGDKGSSGLSNKQFDALNAKLDRLVSLLSSFMASENQVDKKEAKETSAKKTEAKPKKESVAKKPSTKKTATKKAPPKKTTAKKAPAKKTTAKKTTAKKK